MPDEHRGEAEAHAADQGRLAQVEHGPRLERLRLFGVVPRRGVGVVGEELGRRRDCSSSPDAGSRACLRRRRAMASRAAMVFSVVSPHGGRPLAMSAAASLLAEI